MGNPQAASKPRLRLTEARNQLHLSQQALADEIGTNYVNVSRWERGITKPSPYFRSRLCAFFGKSELELDLQPSPISAKSKLDPPFSPATPLLTTEPPLSTALFPPPNVSAAPLYDLAIPSLPAINLVGREREIAHIRSQLCVNNNIALTALNGLPGVGKTALSITLAHDPEVRAHFQDGILWAGLGPTPNMPGLFGRWGSLLGISSTQMSNLRNNEEWARALRIAIGPRRMLLVIDDVWQLEDALTFRVGGANCAHLVTTRFPGIASYMTIDGAMMIQELSEEASVKLLEQLAPQVVSREEQKVHTLVQAVGRLPLALTLIGNYLRKQSYSGQARRITSALESLNDAETRLQIAEPLLPAEGHPSLANETSLSLKSVIAVTDQLLTPSVRATLYALSVFPAKPNTFSEESALAVTACTLDDLDALADAGLLECPSGDRYTLHQIIADYARIHLTGTAPHDRLITYVTHYVEAHKKDYELLEQESNIILAALEITYEQDKKVELVQIACSFAPFLLLRSSNQQAEHHLKRANAFALNLNNHYAIAETLLYLGEVAQKQGNLSQAKTFFLEGLSVARQNSDNEKICALLNNLGIVSWRQGESTQADTYLQEGLKLAREIDDHERICSLLKVLGSVFGSKGNYIQAEIYLQEGLSLARTIGDREQSCILLMNLGAIAGGRGNHVQAETYFQEGLILARRLGDRERMCALLGNIGEAAAEQGHYQQAKIYLQDGLVLAQQIDHQEWISSLLISLGLTTRMLGDYSQARTHFQESLKIAEKIGRKQIICTALYEYGILQLELNENKTAEDTFIKMYSNIPEGNQVLLALAQYGLARIAATKDNTNEAKKLGEISAKALETIGHRNAHEVMNWLDSLEHNNRGV